MAMCCSLGMDPLMFKTLDEQICITDLTKSSTVYIYKEQSNDQNKSGNWKGNLNYWTGGMQPCKGHWGWCTETKISPMTSGLTWASAQPSFHKQKESCMHLRILNNATGAIVTQRDCKDRFIFACQVFLPFS
jgi:hypothetical protein